MIDMDFQEDETKASSANETADESVYKKALEEMDTLQEHSEESCDNVKQTEEDVNSFVSKENSRKSRPRSRSSTDKKHKRIRSTKQCDQSATRINRKVLCDSESEDSGSDYEISSNHKT